MTSGTTYAKKRLSQFKLTDIIHDSRSVGVLLLLCTTISLLITMCDCHPEREPQALTMLERHIRQFNRLYKNEEETE